MACSDLDSELMEDQDNVQLSKLSGEPNLLQPPKEHPIDLGDRRKSSLKAAKNFAKLDLAGLGESSQAERFSLNEINDKQELVQDV